MSEMYRTRSGKVITDEMIEQWAAEAETGYALDESGRQVVLVRAAQTCCACPSQWTAWDADGTEYYLRYRYGCGSVERSVPDGWEVIAQFEHGGPLDGGISLGEFARLAGVRLAEGMS